LSRGSSPSGHPAEPLVSYQINRQFSGWILPPQVIRAFGAHCQQETFCECWVRAQFSGAVSSARSETPVMVILFG
jgi:hypothetical protein